MTGETLRVARLSILFLLPIFSCPTEVGAFKGHEHRQISQVALEVVLGSMEEDASDFSSVRSSLLGCYQEKKRASCFDFGLVTRAVDYVFHPDYLVPEFKCFHNPEQRGETWVGKPERCERKIRPCSKVDVEKGASIDQAEEAFLSYVEDRVTSKARDKLGRLMAVHRNIDHFEACAAENYNRFHQQALDRARSHGLVSALVTEAVALHFLQDAFPPGHLLTPRAHSSDLIARGMHNRHNKEGLVIEVGLAAEELRTSLRELVQEKHESVGWASACAAETALTSGLGSSLTMRGDGVLSQPPNESCQQFIALVLTSAYSIREVVEAGLGTEPADPLRLSFEPWVGARTAGTSAIDRDSLHRPGLSLEGGHAMLLHYPPGLEADELDRWSGRPELTAAAIADSEGETGRRFEFSFIGGFPGDDDIEVEREGDADEGFLRRKVRALHGFLAAGNLSYEEWETYESYGFHLYSYPHLTRHGNAHVNTFLGLGLGVRRFEGPYLESDRFTWGVRGGLGLGVVFLEAGAEDSYRLAGPGRLESTVVWSAGVRIQLVW